jgi:hypothetical protein
LEDKKIGAKNFNVFFVSAPKQWRVASAARWFVFKPEIPIWVNFGVLKIGQC